MMFFLTLGDKSLLQGIITRVLKRVTVMVLMLLFSEKIILKLQHEDSKSFHLRYITHTSVKENMA